jgi:small conductance mechanosensitive channel
MDRILPFLPALFTVIGVGAVLWGLHWFLIGRLRDLGNERKFPRQIVLLGLALAGLLATVLVLPVRESSRNQLIGLIGLLVSGIFAFSSASIIANLMAGILLRMTKPFQTGDFIRVGDHFGRVSERGLFDTEIQAETRELVSLPNSYLINNPVMTIRTSGTILSVSLSLGYDVHHARAEALLIRAAERSGLEEPFVHIQELGDHAVTYRVSGLLTEVKRMLSARSQLCQNILDSLHGQGIEIMSPAVMAQRRIREEHKIIPETVPVVSGPAAVNAEDIAFDKAERAERTEKEKRSLVEEIEALETSLKDAPEEEKSRAKTRIEACRDRLKVLETEPPDPDSEPRPSLGEGPTGEGSPPTMAQPDE